MEVRKLIEMEHIEKSFPGVHALADCRFDLEAGEVHALIGENGAGKSTLMKILSGVYSKDSGTIKVNGKEVEIRGTKDALKNGITIIHQELCLIPHLTVAQNIFIGQEPQKIKSFIDEKQESKNAQDMIDKIKLRLEPNVLVKDLSIAEQYMVEIARAVARNAKVLIMDEPTSALTNDEIDKLFELIEDMKNSGMGIVYISHRMEEIMRITDRVTVMRDGCYIDTMKTSETSIEEIIQKMVGRTIFGAEPELPEHPSKDIVLEVKHMVSEPRVKDASFQLRRGEILGVYGLVGAGRTEVARAIVGADKYSSGEVFINGKQVKIHHPHDAVKMGLGYLPEDRKKSGLMLPHSVETNIAITSYDKLSKVKGFASRKLVSRAADEMVEKLAIATPSTQQLTKNLSGGNQQKVVISKWLVRDCDILIFDEPTRGIDVAAKNEIYKLLNEFVKQGKSIIMISSELPEVLRMSHRILVMCEGVTTGVLDAGEATQEKIMKYATMRNTAAAQEKE